MTRIYNDKKVSGKKDDARVIKSKSDLSKALTELLNEKPYDSITVKDIYTKANISKLCFYNNFLNKDNLMIYILKQTTDNALNSVRQNYQIKGITLLEYSDIIHSLFKMFFSQDSVFRKAISKDINKSLYTLVYNFIKDTIPSLLICNAQSCFEDIPYELIVAYYASALTGILYIGAQSKKLENNPNFIDNIATLAISTLLSKPHIL